MLYFSRHSLNLSYCTRICWVEQPVKLISLNTAADAKSSAQFTGKDEDLKRCCFIIPIELLSLLLLFVIHLAAQMLFYFFLHSCICICYYSFKYSSISSYSSMHNTSWIMLRMGCTHSNAPILKLQTYVCRLDGPCIIYLMHLDDEIRWPWCACCSIHPNRESFTASLREMDAVF